MRRQQYEQSLKKKKVPEGPTQGKTTQTPANKGRKKIKGSSKGSSAVKTSTKSKKKSTATSTKFYKKGRPKQIRTSNAANKGETGVDG